MPTILNLNPFTGVNLVIDLDALNKAAGVVTPPPVVVPPPPPPNSPTNPLNVVPGTPAKVGPDGAFLPGGDIFSIGGVQYSAINTLAVFWGLNPFQQSACVSDTIVTNAIVVYLGREQGNLLIQRRSTTDRYGPGGYNATYKWLTWYSSDGVKHVEKNFTLY